VIGLHQLRADPGALRAAQLARGQDPTLVDALLAADDRRRAAARRYDDLRAGQRALGREIRTADGAPEARAALLARAAALAAEVRAAAADRAESAAEARVLLARCGNLLHPDTPIGGDEDFAVLATSGASVPAPRTAPAPTPTPGGGRTGPPVTGPRALLELALVHAAMAHAAAAGHIPALVPRTPAPPPPPSTGCCPTPLTALHPAPRTHEAARLPLRHAAPAPGCAHLAGPYGADRRDGIPGAGYAGAVQLFTVAAPERAGEEFGRMVECARGWLAALELPYRVVAVASGELGPAAARTVRCEVPLTSRGGRWGEVAHASDAGRYLARRLGLRVRDATGRTTTAATLDGTLCAVPRTLAALLDHHREPDGTVRVPPVLRPWIGGAERLGPEALR
jgi:seryl-tRNA synthetase